MAWGGWGSGLLATLERDNEMTTEDSKTLPLLSLRNLVLFPGAVMPVEIGRPSSLRLIEALGGKGARVLVGTQKDADIEEPASSDLYTICVEGEVVRIVKAAENRVTAVLRGLERRRVTGFVQEKPYLVASFGPLTEIRKDPIEIDGLGMAVYDVAKQLIAISPDIPDETAQVLDQSKDPGRLGDIVAATVDLSPEERASLLVESDVAERLRRLLVLLQRKVELIKVKQKIDSQVREEFSKHQREAVLRQKLKAIQDELGEGDDASDLDAFDEKIKAADMPAEVEKTARKQLDRLKQMAQSSAEYTVQRTYLEWLVELPWTKQTEDRLDLDKAREILDTDHYDLKKVKKRILEYLAVRKLAPGKKGPILCLAGPPGVGKTSLGKSIARSLGREFIRISLGGVRDEAEIRGHRRTYIGALPGRIIQGMRRVGQKNPVFMLDEIDKLGADFRGDPSAALLEVLDPEQNSTFSDHYLEVNFDLSNVIFIATANMLDPIPPALLDRMEVLEIPGLHARGEARDRAAPPRAEADRRPRPHERADPAARRRPHDDHRAVHARGRRPQPRARDRQRHPRRRRQGRREPPVRAGAHARRHRRHARTAEVLLGGRGAHGDPGRRRRGSPGRPRAATSSSSRRRPCSARAASSSRASSATS